MPFNAQQAQPLPKNNEKRTTPQSGLVSKKLGQMVDLDVPVGPERGQVLVTERTKKILPFPAGRIRQNFDGSFMLGNSNEDVGYNIETTSEVMKKISHRAIRVFPCLKNLQLPVFRLFHLLCLQIVFKYSIKFLRGT